MCDKEDVRPVNVNPQCIQEAPQMYFQQIGNNDHKLGFYTMCRRETMGYDGEYMRKCNEDLDTTLIFAGPLSLQSVPPLLSALVRTPARLGRTVRNVPPSNPSQPQPIHFSWRKDRSSPSVERTARRGYHILGSSVREPPGVAFAAFVATLGKQ